MPGSAEKLLDQLGQAPEARTFAALGEAGRLEPGTPVPQPTGVFPRYVEPEAAAVAEAAARAPGRKQGSG
jgi:methionyl-tRNA synthetase